jgi:serine/threonine protein kinase
MSSDDTQSPPPTTLVGGKYEVLGLIGRGGMGSVYEGRHTSLGTPCAIKFIDAQYANSEDARSRFDTEARAAASIQSKHAIQIYDHGVTADGRPYIVMERLLGEPLDQRIKRLGSISLIETARILRQVARALTRAHEHGIVHRDLKPENIFLVRGPDDEEDVAKVLDFGIAKIKIAPGAISVSSSTKTGTLLGTPQFMSPEQARGLRAVDHRTDLWSLGIIVFKCVTGQLPFDGESLGDLLVRICTSPIPVPSSLAPHLPPELDAWMLRALDREPEQRFQSATELADSLGTVAGLSFRSHDAITPEPGRTNARLPSAPSLGGHEFSPRIPGAAAALLANSVPPTRRGASKLLVMGTATLGLAVGFLFVFLHFAGPRVPPATGATVVGSPSSASPLTPASTALPAHHADPTPPAPMSVHEPMPAPPSVSPTPTTRAVPVESSMAAQRAAKLSGGLKAAEKSGPPAAVVAKGTPLPAVGPSASASAPAAQPLPTAPPLALPTPALPSPPLPSPPLAAPPLEPLPSPPSLPLPKPASSAAEPGY